VSVNKNGGAVKANANAQVHASATSTDGDNDGQVRWQQNTEALLRRSCSHFLSVAGREGRYRVRQVRAYAKAQNDSASTVLPKLL